MSPDPQYSQVVALSFAAAPQLGQLSVAGIYYPTKVGQVRNWDDFNPWAVLPGPGAGPGATVTVAKFDYVFTGGNGADTVNIVEVPVVTGTTDSNGEVSFPNLKGEPGYVIKAAPPAGLNLGSARVVIPQAYSSTVRTTLILRKP